MLKKYLTIILLSLALSISSNLRAQNAYRSLASGNWTNITSWQADYGVGWVAAVEYPGSTTGTYTIDIQTGHTITIATNLNTQSMGNVTIIGNLALNVPGNPDIINLNTPLIDINAGNLNFNGPQVRLNLPSNAVIFIQNNGNISSSPCNNNNEIYIGAQRYSSCAGGGSNTYTFGEVVTGNGTINSEIIDPAAGPISSEVCNTIDLEGGYSGPDTNVTFEWILRDPNGNNTTLGTGILANNTQTDTNSFSPTIVGSYLLSLEITSGTFTNVETRSFNISPDTTNPTASNPAPVNVQCAADVPAVNIADVNDEADNCAGTITVAHVSDVSDGNSNPEVITRTYSVTDAAGNSINVTQTITVDDTTNPTASNPAPVNVQCAADVPAVNIADVNDEADNCAGTITVAHVSDVSDGNSNPEVITRTYSVTDAAGNSINVTQTITVDDTTNPTASNPAPVNVQCAADVPAVNIADVNDEADNCAGTITVAHVSDVSDGNSNPEVITRTYSVTDAAGNSINVTQTITVDDTTNPTASNPAPVNVQCAADVPAVNIADVNDEADNCAGTITVAHVSDVSDGNSNPEVITRTYSVTDAAGNSINVTQTITVDDTTNPTASNPAPVNVQCAADVPAVNIADVNDEADNCAGTITVAHVSDVSDGNSNPEVITRTYSVTDAAGNSINVTQTITVDDTTNPTASNPAPVNVQCAADVPAVNIADVNDEADNCAGTITVAHVSDVSDGNSNPEVITRTYSVTDAAGNSINVTQTITVDDTTNPTASNPAPVNVQCAADVPAVNIADVNDEADNCAGTITVAHVSDVSDGNSNPEVITRTYSVTDAAGNSINVTQTITVDDTTNPTASNPAPVNVQCAADVPAVNIADVNDEADNCAGTITVAHVSDVSDGNSNPEVITRTYSVTDAAGNSINVTQTITVDDTTNPTASNPAPVNVQCAADVPAVNIADVNDEADNCAGTITVAHVSDVSDGNSNPEVITRTYSVTDAAGNSINVTQTITVDDTTNPTASNPAPVNVQCAADVPAVNIADVNDEADNCAGTITVAHVSDVSDGNSNPEVITRTYSVTDAAGNSINVTQTITVDDTTNPTASNPAPVNVQCAADVPAVNIADVNDEADNCAGTITVAHVSDVSDGNSNPEVITRTYSVTDAAGNSINVTQTITVDDTTNPTASNPAPVNVQCAADVPAVNIADVNDEADNCAGTITVAHVSDVSDGNSNPEVITRTYSVTDAAGNSINVTQTITVDDTTNPTASNPAPVNVQCAADVPAVNIADVNDEADNCAGTITVAHVSDVSDGNSNPEVITRTYSVTDAAGNSINVTQTITVDDTTNPTASNPAPVNVQCAADVPAVNIADVNDEADNCAGTITVAHVSDVSDGNSNPEVITRTYSVTDAAGNSINVTQTITVDDTTNPTASNPAPVNVQCAADVPAVNIADVNDEADNCAGTITVAHVSDVSDGNSNPEVITRTYSVTDAAGNSINVTQTITVDDTTNPTITCPANITTTTSNDGTGNCTTAVVLGNPTVSDNCTATGSLTITNNAPATFPIGTTIVTWTVTDTAGNQNTCTQNVTVTDNENPTITCPADVTVSANASCMATGVALGTPATADNCGVASVTNDAPSSFPLGNTTVTWTVTDNAGLTATCTQTVTVEDTTNPTSVTLPILEGQCSYTITTAPTINDNCAGTISGTTTASLPITFNTQGAHFVTWTFNDGNGNSIDIDQTVLIDDDTPPIASCLASIDIPLDPNTGLATITAADLDTGSSDNCGNVTLSISQSSFDCTNVGPNYVILTVDDGHGNIETCTTIVNILDPNVTGGTLTGYAYLNETSSDADALVELTACPLDTSVDPPVPASHSVILNLSGETGNITGYEFSTDGGVNWTYISTSDNPYSFDPIQETTLARAVVSIGSCEARSSIVVMAVIPPDIPPTIVTPIGEHDSCLPDSITVVAESEYGINSDFNEGGDFNSANLNNLGWLVDGDAEMSAGGNNTNNTYWKETNGPKKFNGRCYETPDNSKFAIVSGIPPYDAPDHTISPLSTLETPIFNTLGLSTATLEFDQAYYLEDGAWIKIELSTDGGATYPITLDPGIEVGGSNIVFDYIGPSDTGFGNVGFNGQCRNSPGTYVNHATSIDLQNYIGLTGLRIKFTYSGTANSSWAMDNIHIPQAPVDEVIEWTDEYGVVVTTGSTTTITPVTPGIQVYGATSLINGCRAEGDEGTNFVTINASLAYFEVKSVEGECGGSVFELKAYDNNLRALDNIANGIWDPSYQIPQQVMGDHDDDPNTPDQLFYPTNYPGTGEDGFWSVASTPLCGNVATFSDVNSPNSTFYADPGTYIIKWTVAGCETSYQVTVNSCDNINFDGQNDFVSFEDNYSLSANFSVEAWVKPNDIANDDTILSKRLDGDMDKGYDLGLRADGRVRFSWFRSGPDGYIQSQYPISTDRWYHIAVTYGGGTYKMYIDGVDVGQTNGTIGPPTATNVDVECLLGAMDPGVGTSVLATNHYEGWMDELRIWNKVLTVEQIRNMMNQRIHNNGSTVVRGEVVPQDISGLAWDDLDGYYRMGIGCNELTAVIGPNGTLRNIDQPQTANAPLPYTSRVDGQNWATDNSWTHFNVWEAPNSLGIDRSTPIDWNIVRLSHNMNSGNKDITVLGLISDTTNKELTIADPGTAQDETNDGQMLWVTHYLKLDGRLDLVGESQLIQKRYNSNQILPSIFDNTSAGYAERDQQGQVNPYNYNYFSPPFAPNNATVNNENTSNTYSIGSVLRDGTTTVANPINRNIVWTTNNTATGGDPTQVSTRWLYAYNDNTGNTYSEWEYLNTSGTLNIGLGYTMKGSGNATAEQNYVFVGKPNNGTISNNVSPETGGLANDILLGNPYPSAIDANEFIKDNIPLFNPDGSPSQANSDTSESIFGPLYFWEHYSSNNTHILREYQGGYATYSLSGGVEATTPPVTEDGVIIIGGIGTTRPTRYVPVAQGFFVTGSPGGGPIKFHNDQRIFKREGASDGNVSIFFEANNDLNKTVTNADTEDIIKRIRLNFKSPEGAVRPLLLAFLPNNQGDDGFNYGYDAPNYDTFPSDLSWSIENERYVIQGVGVFDDTKKYPLILEAGNSGEIEITLNDLENFDAAIDVYIYDALLETYTRFNETAFKMALDVDVYLERFYLAFSNEESLNPPETEIDSIRVYYLNDTNEIYINWAKSYDITQVELINIIGQTVKTYTDIEPINSHEIRIPVKNISEGNYVIKVLNNHGMSTNKKIIIKQ